MTSAPVAVVADSACDLPPETAAAAGVRIVPLTVAFGASAFLDGVDLPADAFWDRVTASPELPTTASPSPQAFLEAYVAAHAAGAGSIVSIHVSGSLSRTAESARSAASEAPVPVEVVDTRSVSLGEGLVALAAAAAARAGGGVQDVARAAREASARLAVVAMLDTVEFLKRGGRVGRAKAAMSDLLRIRPLLSLDDGDPVLVAKARTRRRGLEELLDRAAGPAERAGVFHARAEEADAVASELRRRCGVEPVVGVVGAVTGTHLGPRAVGVAVLRPVD